MERALTSPIEAVGIGVLISRDRLVVVDRCAIRVCGDTSVGAAVSDGENVAAVVWLAVGRCG